MPLAHNLQDNVVDGVAEILELSRQGIQGELKKLLPSVRTFTIYKDRQLALELLPCIEIVRGPVKTTWFAVTTYQYEYTLYLDCTGPKSPKREFGTQFISVFADLVTGALNHFDNKQFDIPLTTAQVFNSQSQGWDPNYRRVAGLRTARITYMAQVLNQTIPDNAAC